MERWLKERLSTCLDFDIPDDMIKYVMSIKTPTEFDEYFETLLNKECEEHRLFLSDCKQRLFSKVAPNKKFVQQQPPKKAQSHSSNQIKQNHSSKQQQCNPKKDCNPFQQHSQTQGAKKKNKFVNLYTTEGTVVGDTIKLKGRRLCECQASQHKLINNCLSCGRVVCDQEGSGPCLFCGEIVCTTEEMQIIKSSSKKAEHLMKTLKEQSCAEPLLKALEQRDRLLEYDRNSEKRTTVIDDELDYFQENSVWLSDAEREKFERLKQEMYDKKHASRAQRKIKVDFAGRPENEELLTEADEQNILQQLNQNSVNNDNWSNRSHTEKLSDGVITIDPNLDAVRPVYHPTTESKASAKLFQALQKSHLEGSYSRVQDKELLEMQDSRKCLSMHQPWASLLVAGIKKHEGRIWYTEHRGRLWIAATAKDPHPEEVLEVENFYRKYYNDSNIKFPEHYPTGCLLGCVKLEECLPQEEYRDVYPNGESESPYVFICSNPEQLPVVFPIKGQHKIYQIDPKIHNAVCKILLRIKTAIN